MRRVLLAAALLLVAVVAPAAGQETGEEGVGAEAITTAGGPEGVAAEPRAGFWEGGGVAVTEGTVLHTGVEVSSGYQSNVFFQDADDGPSGPLSSAVARFSIGASFGTLTPARLEALAPGSGVSGPRIIFSLEALLTWVQYLSGRQEISNQSDLGVGLNADVKLNPTGRVTFSARDSFVRSVNPGQSLREDLDRDRNELNARLAVRPGGGAIEGYLGYTFVVDVFEQDVLLFQNRLSHTFTLGAGWRWLPKTLINLEGSFGIYSPDNTTVKSESRPIRVTAGISSLITPVFGFIVRGGYGNGGYARNGSVSTWLALVEARLAIGPTLRTAVGYSHDFADALLGNAYIDHQFFARAGWQVIPRLQLRAAAELRLRSYTGIVDAPNLDLCGDASCANFRDDVLGRLEVGAEIQIRPWLFAGAGYSLQYDATDFFIRGSAVDSGAYVANEIFGKVAARF